MGVSGIWCVSGFHRGLIPRFNPDVASRSHSSQKLSGIIVSIHRAASATAVYSIHQASPAAQETSSLGNPDCIPGKLFANHTMA